MGLTEKRTPTCHSGRPYAQKSPLVYLCYNAVPKKRGYFQYLSIKRLRSHFVLFMLIRAFAWDLRIGVWVRVVHCGCPWGCGLRERDRHDMIRPVYFLLIYSNGIWRIYRVLHWGLRWGEENRIQNKWKNWMEKVALFVVLAVTMATLEMIRFQNVRSSWLLTRHFGQIN